jgi:hypothetical protein
MNNRANLEHLNNQKDLLNIDKELLPTDEYEKKALGLAEAHKKLARSLAKNAKQFVLINDTVEAVENFRDAITCFHNAIKLLQTISTANSEYAKINCRNVQNYLELCRINFTLDVKILAKETSYKSNIYDYTQMLYQFLNNDKIALLIDQPGLIKKIQKHIIGCSEYYAKLQDLVRKDLLTEMVDNIHRTFKQKCEEVKRKPIPIPFINVVAPPPTPSTPPTPVNEAVSPPKKSSFISFVIVNHVSLFKKKAAYHTIERHFENFNLSQWFTELKKSDERFNKNFSIWENNIDQLNSIYLSSSLNLDDLERMWTFKSNASIANLLKNEIRQIEKIMKQILGLILTLPYEELNEHIESFNALKERSIANYHSFYMHFPIHTFDDLADTFESIFEWLLLRQSNASLNELKEIDKSNPEIKTQLTHSKFKLFESLIGEGRPTSTLHVDAPNTLNCSS